MKQSYLQVFPSKYFVDAVKHFALGLNASTSRIATEMIKSPAEVKHEIWSTANMVMVYTGKERWKSHSPTDRLSRWSAERVITQLNWENYFIVIGWEQANLSLIFNLHCSANWRALSWFSQSYNKWVIVCRLEQLRIYSTRDNWKFSQDAFAGVQMRVQFLENFEISLVVKILNCTRIPGFYTRLVLWINMITCYT